MDILLMHPCSDRFHQMPFLMRQNLHSGIVPQGISDLECDVIVGHECRGFCCVGSESLLVIFDTPLGILILRQS